MIFKNKNKIEHLKSIIIKQLKPEITSDYVLLDIPNHHNIGDTLIWQGELEFLKNVTHNLTYSSNIYTHKNSKVHPNNTILLQGGGNFGDTWPAAHKFRNTIIKDFPDNKIIIFPQTIFYNNEAKLAQDAKLYNSHPDLVICTRDNISYATAKKHFHSCKVILAPDMAFCNDFSQFHHEIAIENPLLMQRVDKELGETSILSEVKNNFKDDVTTQDWPGFYYSKGFKFYKHKIKSSLETRGTNLLKNSPLKFLVHDIYGLNNRNYKDLQILKGINFINQFAPVYSTRLHGAILAILLNKETYIFDNSYGKNKNFFNTWLTDFENVSLIEKE